MTWTKYEKSKAKAHESVAEPQLSFYVAGGMRLNKDAVTQFHNGEEFAELYVDFGDDTDSSDQAERIGIEFLENETDNSYKVTKKSGGVTISPRSFLRTIGISQATETLRAPVSQTEDGIITAELQPLYEHLAEQSDQETDDQETDDQETDDWEPHQAGTGASS